MRLNSKTCKRLRRLIPNSADAAYQRIRLPRKPDVPQAQEEGFHCIRNGTNPVDGNTQWFAITNPIRLVPGCGRATYLAAKKEFRRG